ncbi:TPA_asm: hypothetical protein [Altiarchaeum virus]|nr:MAG: hypothetical protein BWK75_06335 [Candidatus Altiarchaeales archaeon A3]DAZ85572.1 TPA_asm: hypothetical protein [Altiarchaeum virus]
MRLNFSISLSEEAGHLLQELANKQQISISKYLNDIILSQQETKREKILRLLNILENKEMPKKNFLETIGFIKEHINKI